MGQNEGITPNRKGKHFKCGRAVRHIYGFQLCSSLLPDLREITERYLHHALPSTINLKARLACMEAAMPTRGAIRPQPGRAPVSRSPTT